MAQEPEQVEGELQPIEGGDEPDETPGYKAPAQVSLDTIQQLDADDESLVKYKKALLGQAESVLDEGGPNVRVKQMIFQVEGRKDVELNLEGDLSKLKDNPIVVKEGVEYKLVVVFRVQREIVSGLRYFHTVHRKGIKVDKANYMVGSYGPKTEAHNYVSPKDEVPKGMIARGTYHIKSKFTDDDKVSHLEWEWVMDIKKDWE